MFHMLTCFNLKRGEDMGAFSASYAAFFADMRKQNLVEETGPIGRRQSDTPMDTDDERAHEFFVIMSFKDRAQVDAAYAYIKKHLEPGRQTHDHMYAKVEDPIFICWQDLT